ncbi:SusC/RagA family TonB-linked outer membrane protein, partial [Butyricimonas virosa]
MEKNRDYDIGWGSNVIKKMFRIMKGFICFLILGLSTVSASTFSQVRVSIDMKNATLKEVFKEITKVTGYEFVYSNNEVESVGKISLHVENKDLRDVLAECLKGTQLWYMIENQLVVVSPKLTNPKVVQDNKSTIVSGKVMDQDKNPLPGVTILLKGTTTGVVTNVDGVFFIMVPDTTANVEFIISFVGMKTKTVNLKNRPKTGDWVITMEEDLLEMEEVVVTTGYQNLKKSQIAGSVSVVKAEKVKIGGVPSIENMLQGQITGMNVIINSGDPGASAKIRIRGTSSILGNRAPLWVLDGVILTEDDMGEISTTDLNGDDAAYLVGNAISGINPNDIESITVLKDASATAIYGVQAANGVIVVTTKQGQTGPPKLSYSGSYAINQRMAYSDLERMNATERLQLSKEIIEDNSYYSSMPVDYGYEGLYIDWLARKITYDEFAEGVQKLADMNTDWYDILFRNSFTHAHSLSLSGGKEGTRYYASLGYDDTQSTAIKNYSRRFTATAKVNSWLLKDKLYMNFQVNASTKNTLGFHSSVNPNTYAYNTSRAIPCYNDDGSLFFY